MPGCERRRPPASLASPKPGIPSTRWQPMTCGVAVQLALALVARSAMLEGPLMPSTTSRQVALAVAIEAQLANLAEQTMPEELERRVKATMWEPRYRRRIVGSGGQQE